MRTSTFKQQNPVICARCTQNSARFPIVHLRFKRSYWKSGRPGVRCHSNVRVDLTDCQLCQYFSYIRFAHFFSFTLRRRLLGYKPKRRRSASKWIKIRESMNRSFQRKRKRSGALWVSRAHYRFELGRGKSPFDLSY